MLTRLRVKNFRLLRDVTIDLGPLTVLIGPNSAGKSTVLEVLDFIARCTGGTLQDAVAAHGGMDSIRTIGVREPVEIETTGGLLLAAAMAVPTDCRGRVPSSMISCMGPRETDGLDSPRNAAVPHS